MAPTVRRLRTVEAALIGQRLTPEVVQAAVARVTDDVSPIDDVRSTSAYRLTTSQRLLKHFSRQLFTLLEARTDGAMYDLLTLCNPSLEGLHRESPSPVGEGAGGEGTEQLEPRRNPESHHAR